MVVDGGVVVRIERICILRRDLASLLRLGQSRRHQLNPTRRSIYLVPARRRHDTLPAQVQPTLLCQFLLQRREQGRHAEDGAVAVEARWWGGIGGGVGG